MNERTETEKVKRNRTTRCPQCGENFFSRKARHRHQMLVHRQPGPKAKLRPAAELYKD